MMARVTTEGEVKNIAWNLRAEAGKSSSEDDKAPGRTMRRVYRVVMSMKHLEPADERSVEILCYGLDITHFESEKLEQMGFLMGGMVHDLKTVIRHWDAYVSLTKEYVKGSGEITLTKARRGLNRLRYVSERYNVLVSSDRLFRRNESVNVNRLCSEQIEEFADAYPNIEFRFEVVPEEFCFRLKGKKVALRILLDNILTNGIEAIGDEDGEIVTRIASEKGFTCLTIWNSGPTASEQQLRTFFQLFRTTKKKGLGMGNFITYRIVQLHGGHVAVDNTSEPPGVVVNLVFPKGK